MIAIDHRCHFSYCASARLALREEECQQDRGRCRVVTRLTTIAPKRKNKMQNTEIQACKIQKYNLANTKIQARKIKKYRQSEINNYCTKTKTKSVSKTERAAGWSSGSPPIAPGRKNKMRNSEIQAFKIQKYRQSEISQYCTKRKTKFYC